MFIEHRAIHLQSSFRSETNIALLKEPNECSQIGFHKYFAPTGLKTFSRGALPAQCPTAADSMMLQLNRIDDHVAFAFDNALLFG